MVANGGNQAQNCCCWCECTCNTVGCWTVEFVQVIPRDERWWGRWGRSLPMVWHCRRRCRTRSAIRWTARSVPCSLLWLSFSWMDLFVSCYPFWLGVPGWQHTQSWWRCWANPLNKLRFQWEYVSTIIRVRVFIRAPNRSSKKKSGEEENKKIRGFGPTHYSDAAITHSHSLTHTHTHTHT